MTEKITFQEMLISDKPMLVDFTATWCGPCKMMAPVLEQLKNQIGDKARIVKVDVDRNGAFAISMGVQGVPTFVLFKKGKEEWRHVGMITSEQLRQVLEQHA